MKGHDTIERFLTTTDGLKLFLREWESSSPKAACLLVHGLGEHSGRYQALAHRLTQEGFTVFSMDHRGHGRSEGIRGDCRGLSDFLQDLHQLVQRIHHNSPGLPLFLIGHSLGGLIALSYAVSHPRELKAVAVSSPAFKLAHPPSKMKEVVVHSAARILPKSHFPNGVDPQLLCRDPQVVEEYEKDPHVHRMITARCAVALQRAMAQSSSLAKKLTVPCLILQGGGDAICDPEEMVSFAEQAPASCITFRRYEGFYHELFNEPEKDRVIEELCQWLKGQAGR